MACSRWGLVLLLGIGLSSLGGCALIAGYDEAPSASADSRLADTIHDAGLDSRHDLRQDRPTLPADGMDATPEDTTIDTGRNDSSPVDSSNDTRPVDTTRDTVVLGIDYVPTRLVIPTSIVITKEFVVKATLNNIGSEDGTAGGGFDFLYCELILSPDASPDTPADDIFLMGGGYVAIPGPIPAQESRVGAQAFTIEPTGASSAPGRYYAFLRVNQNADSEASVLNNVYQHPVQIDVVAFSGTPVTIETFPTGDPDTLRTSLAVFHDDGTTQVSSFWGTDREKSNGYRIWEGELEPGRYFVQLGSYATDGYGAYGIIYYRGLSASYNPAVTGRGATDPDPYEPDDDHSQATELVEDVQQEHTITSTPTNYHDWFAITVP